jgi:hypothetical protein
MTDTRKPPACHYDRALGQRVTTDHRDDCPRELETGDCPAAGRGCAPCTAPHCLICGRNHATNAEPDTCGECIGKVREDLTEIAADYQALTVEAIAGGSDGRLVAAAPIPGGTAAVLTGPTVRLDQLRVGRGYGLTELAEVNRTTDPIPPLAVLAHWEDLYRAWFDHTRGGTAKADAYAWYAGRPPSRATVAAATRYLAEQLDHMANGPAVRQGPDWVAFTRSVRNLRADLERALHDEQEPERGVSCFECGDRLVRRFRDPKRCTHPTQARTELQRALVRQAEGQAWMRSVLATYPELPVREEDLAAARGPSAALVVAARRPCARCEHRQGGLDDPRAGRSWECPGCRKQYDPGEYVTAVRRDLLDSDPADGGGGWTNVTMAAEAATTLVGMLVTDGLVRKWMERRKVAVCSEWRPRRRWGQRLVFWPDVADEANAAVDRAVAAARTCGPSSATSPPPSRSPPAHRGQVLPRRRQVVHRLP